MRMVSYVSEVAFYVMVYSDAHTNILSVDPQVKQ